jgi:hypothetical protein
MLRPHQGHVTADNGNSLPGYRHDAHQEDAPTKRSGQVDGAWQRGLSQRRTVQGDHENRPLISEALDCARAAGHANQQHRSACLADNRLSHTAMQPAIRPTALMRGHDYHVGVPHGDLLDDPSGSRTAVGDASLHTETVRDKRANERSQIGFCLCHGASFLETRVSQAVGRAGGTHKSQACATTLC